MKKRGMNQHQHSTGALMLSTAVLPPFLQRIRRLLNTTYAAYGGAEHMTLDEWRDVELEINRRLVSNRGA